MKRPIIHLSITTVGLYAVRLRNKVSVVYRLPFEKIMFRKRAFAKQSVGSVCQALEQLFFKLLVYV